VIYPAISPYIIPLNWSTWNYFGFIST